MIVERKLTLIKDGERIPIKVAVSAPRYLTESERIIGDMTAACTVHTGIQDAGQHDVYGVDELQALCGALTEVDLFLKGLGVAGTITWEDGRPYDPELEAPFTSFLRDVIKKMAD